MNWLDKIDPQYDRRTVSTKMIIFEEESDAAVYGDLINSITRSPYMELISEDENWDQTGILTKIVTYSTQDSSK